MRSSATPIILSLTLSHNFTLFFFFFNDTATTEIYTLSLHDALPILAAGGWEWGCVRIEMSGKVTVITGATPHGQGQETSFAQIAADKLGVPIEDIVVMRGDTAVAHYGRDTYGSRATVIGGAAILICIDKIIAKA